MPGGIPPPAYIPTAAIAGALSKMYLVQTSLIVLASIACEGEEKQSNWIEFSGGQVNRPIHTTERKIRCFKEWNSRRKFRIMWNLKFFENFRFKRQILVWNIMLSKLPQYLFWKVAYINSCLQLMQRDPTTVAQHLSADVLTDGCGPWAQRLKTKRLNQNKNRVWSVCQRSSFTIEVQQHVGLEQVLCPRHFALRNTCAKRHPARQTCICFFNGSGHVNQAPLHTCAPTIPSECSESCPWQCWAHTQRRAPRDPCLCSRCWRTGSCGTGFPDRPFEPVYWTNSATTEDTNEQNQQFVLTNLISEEVNITEGHNCRS